MLRMLIVDDEYLVLERLRRCVDWSELGIEIGGEATDGQEALALFEQIDPHIVITDINMPYINGLDFSKLARQRRARCRFVMLTGHSDFEYAREALHIGASGYLLKPINKSDLTALILSLKEQIESEERASRYLEELKLTAKAGNQALREQLLQTLVRGAGKRPATELVRAFACAYPALQDEPLVLALFELRFSAGCFSPEDKELCRFAVGNIAKDVFAPSTHFETINHTSKHVALIINARQEDLDHCVVLCNRVRELMMTYLNLTMTVGVSRAHADGLSAITRAYAEAVEALDSKLVLGIGRIIRYDRLKRAPFPESSINLREDLLIHFRLGNLSTIRKKVHEMFEEAIRREISVDALCLLLSELLLVLSDFSKEKGVARTEEDGVPLSINALLEEREELAQVEEAFCERAVFLIRRYGREQLLSYSGLVGRTKRYIDQNYNDKAISLNTIAEAIEINPCHLSTVFKRESKHSVIEYLTQCRMHNAKRLLDEGKTRLVDVADTVGYSDPYYFSKCFKRVFGLSPSHYIKLKTGTSPEICQNIKKPT